MSLFDSVIIIAVLIWFGLLTMSKLKKKPMGECVKDIIEWFKEKPEPLENLKK